ncbi:MAG: polysaccharide biosynthesis protein [Lachnospiraceae bacterium]|nr:polysaccharide biosynthesis protein [Candidatus Merdinaster equi]
MSKETQTNIVKQAGVLAAAGILVKIIGILYRSPLTGLIGDEGNGYYSSAYNIYIIILMLSSYNIPAAVSKLIAEKLALKEYRNAHRVFLVSLVYVMVMGVIAAFVLYMGAELFVGHNAASVLRVFAPTIIIFGPLGALRGYFQAHHTMTPTSISQIFEQVFNAGISILAAFIFTGAVGGMTKAARESTFAGDAGLLSTASAFVLGESAARTTDTQRAVSGAAGSALGTGAGVLVAAIFMGYMYYRRRKQFRTEIALDKQSVVLPYKAILKQMILMVTPILLSNFIYNFCNTLNQSIYFGILRGVKGISEAEASTMFGIYAGKASIIVNVPIAIAAAMSSVMIPAVSAAYAHKNMEEIKEKISTAIRVTMLVAIPSAVGLFALAKPVTQLLFPQKVSLDAASSLLMGLAITVVFFSISTITNAVLQGMGKVNKPVVNSAISLVIQAVVLTLLLLLTNFNLYALVIASILYSALMVYLNSKAIYKETGYKQEIRKTFVLPFVAAAIMGVVAFFVYFLVNLLVRTNVIAFILAVGVAVMVYFAVLIMIGGATEADLKRFPKGALIIKLAKKVKILK